MFEQKINETIAYLSENSIGNMQSISLREIFASSMPDSMMKIFEIEVQQWVEEEKKRLLDAPHFDYSEDEVLQLIDQIVFKAGEYATFTRAEFDETLDRSVKLLYNFLCRPQWTMKKYVFADRDNATTASVMETLQYFRDYEYYKLILSEYFDKKQIDVLNAKKFENLLENIDEEIVRTFDSRKMAQLTEPIFTLFSIGVQGSEARIPIEAASIFFDDKNITSVVERLDSEKNKTDTLTLHDLTMLIGEVDFTMSLDISNIVTQHAGQLEGLPDMDTNMGRDFDVPDIEDDKIESFAVSDASDFMESEEDDTITQHVMDDIPVIEENEGEEIVLTRDNDFEFDDTYDNGLQSGAEADTGEFQEYETDTDGISVPEDVVLEEEVPTQSTEALETLEGFSATQDDSDEGFAASEESEDAVNHTLIDQSGFQETLPETVTEEFSTEDESFSADENLQDADDMQDVDDIPEVEDLSAVDDLDSAQDDQPLTDDDLSLDEELASVDDGDHDLIEEDIVLQDVESSSELDDMDDSEQEIDDADLSDINSIEAGNLDEVELPDIVLDDSILESEEFDADVMLEEDQATDEEKEKLDAEDIFRELELDSLEDLDSETEADEEEQDQSSTQTEDGVASGAGDADPDASEHDAAAAGDTASTTASSTESDNPVSKDEVISSYGDIHSAIAASDKKKYVKRLFNKDSDALDNAINTLNGKATWREASEFIDELFIKYEVDMYSRVAVKFTDDIYKRYLNKKS